MEKKLTKTLISILALIVIYIGSVLAVPSLSIWSLTQSFNKDGSDLPLTDGSAYEQEFDMPFSRISAVEIPIDPAGSDNVIPIDATLILTDTNGSVITEKNITSAYDTYCSFRFKTVERDAKYRLRLTVNHVGKPSDDRFIPRIKADNGKLMFSLKGIKSNGEFSHVYLMIYFITAAAVLIFVMKSDIEKIGDAKLYDSILTGILLLLSLFIICQYYDYFMIAKSALRMIDSFKTGNFRNYMDYSYMSELGNQSSKMLFAYEYNFFSILSIAILMLPILPFCNGDVTYANGGDLVCGYLSIVICLLLFAGIYLMRKCAKECGMDKRYKDQIGIIFITSSMMLYSTVAYGQIDIIYMCVILYAMVFYFRKRYLAFSVVMSLAVAMKTLPLFIFVPLILLVFKQIKDIFIHMAVVMILPAVSKVLFEGNFGHAAVANIIDEDYKYVERITEMKLGSLSLFVLAFALICIFCYMHKADTENKKDMLFKSMLLIFVTYTCFAAFVDWHQQWLLPLCVAFAFLLPFFEENKSLLLLSAAAEFLFILTTNTQGVSIYQINYGILPKLTNHYYEGTSVMLILNNLSSIAVPAIRTLFAAVLFYLAAYFVRHRTKDQKTYECARTWTIGRMGILYVFILFYSWCFGFIG